MADTTPQSGAVVSIDGMGWGQCTVLLNSTSQGYTSAASRMPSDMSGRCTELLWCDALMTLCSPQRM